MSKPLAVQCDGTNSLTEAATQHSHVATQGALQAAGLPADFIPLHLEPRTHVQTSVMCAHLGVKPQTARIWACKSGKGPLSPIRINGRLAWQVAEIKKILGVA